MGCDPKVKRLAKAVVQHHGHQALALAKDRVRMWLDAEDYPWVSIWAQVAQEVGNIIPEAGATRTEVHDFLRKLGDY